MQYLVRSNIKAFTGEIRSDFRAIMDAGKSPAEKLELILKHTDYEPSASERLLAIKVIDGLNRKTDSVYRIIRNMDGHDDLLRLANAIEAGFEFKDKTTPRWGLLYALIARLPSGDFVAEMGVTEKSVSTVINRLGLAKAATYNTKIGWFLKLVEQNAVPCYLFPLESHFADLDVLGVVKDRWKLAGLAAGIQFPTRPYTMRDFRKPVRVWPLFDNVVQLGLKVREVQSPS